MHMGQFNLFNADGTVQFVQCEWDGSLCSMHMGQFSLFNADGMVQFVQCRWDGSICSMHMGQFSLLSADGAVQFVLVLLWKGSVVFSMLSKSRMDGVSGEASGKPPV